MTTQFDVPACKDTLAGGIDFLESIPGLLKSFKFGLRLHWLSESILGLLKRLQIRAQATLAVGIDSWAP
jgi:hypothetical protein